TIGKSKRDDLISMYSNIIHLYGAIGDLDEAMKWFKEAARLKNILHAVLGYTMLNNILFHPRPENILAFINNVITEEEKVNQEGPMHYELAIRILIEHKVPNYYKVSESYIIRAEKKGKLNPLALGFYFEVALHHFDFDIQKHIRFYDSVKEQTRDIQKQ